MASSTQKLFTSAAAEEALRALQKATDLNGATLGRLALAVSLSELPDLDLPDVADETGVEFNRYSLLAEWDLLFLGLVTEAHGHKPAEDVFFSRYIKAHVDRGLKILRTRLEEVGSGEELLATLAVSHESGETESVEGEFRGGGACVSVVGEELGTHEPVVCELNNMHRSANAHLAIVGIPGTGKTQILLKILADVVSRPEGQAPSVVFIDYKGDVSANAAFVKLLAADVYQVPHDRLPINPFILPRYGEQDIKISAEEKAESFSSFQRLGPVQRGRLATAIRNAYEARRAAPAPYPDFEELALQLAAICEEEGAKADTLTETVRKLSDFGLFWSHKSEAACAETLWKKNVIINLSAMPALKELVAFLTIERLYREMAQLSDARVDAERGLRELRCILVIDEAHNYLPKRNVFLERLIREGRSKGFAVFLSSQSPNDFDQGDFNYAELLQFVFVLRSTSAAPKAMAELIRCSPETARSLVAELANLMPFECVCNNLTQSAKRYTRFRAKPFYEAHK